MPAEEYPWLAAFYAIFALTAWAAFRSRVDLNGDQVTVVNPWTTTTLDRRDVLDITPGSWGTELHRAHDRPVIVFAVQSTFGYWGRPRWVDLAEAIVGRRP